MLLAGETEHVFGSIQSEHLYLTFVTSLYTLPKEKKKMGRGLKVFYLVFWFIFFTFTASFSAQQEDVSEILKDSNLSVVTLMMYDSGKKLLSEGKGVIIAPNGLVLTNYHLISQAHSAKAHLATGRISKRVEWEDVFYPGFETAAAAAAKKKKPKGRVVDVEGIVSVDKKLDLALIKIKGRGLPTATLSSSDNFEIGNKTHIVVEQEALSEGSVTNQSDLSSTKKLAQMSLYLASSMSGSPVFSSQGEVVGIASYIAENANIIIPATYASSLDQEGKPASLSQYSHEDFFKVAEGLYLKGIAHSLLDNYTQALNLMEESVQMDPNYPDAQSQLGFLYSRLNQYENAVGAYTNALNMDPNNYRSAFGLGIAHIRLNQFQQAISPLTQCTKINPSFPDAFFNLGQAYERLEQLENAAQAYEQFNKINPGPAWTGLNQVGAIYAKLGQYEKAIVAFQEVLKERPGDIKANYNIAYAYDNAGQYNEAASYYRKLIDLNPEDAKAYYSLLFRLFDKAGDMDQAIDAGKEIVKLNPEDSQSHYNLGIIYMKKKDFPNALEAFNQALFLNPDFDQVYYNIGLLNFQQKKYLDAVQAFSKFTEFKPQNADAFHNIGISYLQLKKYEQALEPLQKAIELRQDYDYAHYHLGICYFALKDRFSANEEHKILKDLNPDLAAKLWNIINK
jgi:tetratricopeptide (TPR) repeat protein